MNLRNFTKYINKTIVGRGQEYYMEGRIARIEECGDHRYVASVDGRDRYTVTVELDGQEDIAEITCDCPYTGGDYCKHMAAVLFALTERDRHSTVDDFPADRRKAPAQAVVKKSVREQLAQKLAAQPKERLLALLLALADEDKTIAAQLQAEVAEEADERKKWIQLMQHTIKKAMDRHGFIDYRQCQYAVAGAYKVLGRAQQAVDDRKYGLAVDLVLCVMHEMVEMLQFADDSDGDVGMVMDEAYGLMATAAPDMPEAAKTVCFPQILAAAADRCYDGWSDWRINLLEICAVLTVTAQQRAQLERYLPAIADGGKYEAEAIALLRYGLIQQFDGAAQAVNFLHEYRHFSRLRELMIQAAMTEKDWARAEALALEGEAQDSDLPGLVRKWKKYRFEVYQKDGRRGKLLEVGRELAITGDFDAYLAFKRLYPKQEWAAIYPGLVEEFARQPGVNAGYSYNYTAIVNEEQDWPRLWEYVQKNPWRIQEFYRQLLPDYGEQVFALFDRLIRHDAARSSKRSHYRNVCSQLRLLAKIGGKKGAGKLVDELLAKYPRRPAFREELLMVKNR